MLPDGLTSLEWLTIGDCPGIEEFPPDLQQRLPDLKYLGIEGCPDLLRRCGEGGEYFNLISSIPDKDIRVAEDRELPVKRLLPLCGGDSQLRLDLVFDHLLFPEAGQPIESKY
ncbi:hypothetical protein EJB05_47867, partial [Eragrostis curvula]